ncbi:MAG TPA: ferritin [Anaerolineales bacterium]|nr:ferritin [Anaerolineales bacterium]
MLISKELEEAINAQIGREFGASLQYTSIAAYFDADDLPNLAAFFYRQASEEHMHAMKFLHYVVDAGGQVRIPAIPATKYDFANAGECAQLALDWETEVTRQINALMDLAIAQKDHIAQDFLRWFVTEQLEEISTMEQMISIIRRGKDNLLFVDDYIARNPIVPPEGAAGAEAA